MAVSSRLALSFFAVLSALTVCRPAAAASPRQVHNVTKGQGQLAGGNGEFGTIYSIRGFNVEILSAKYSLDPYVAYNPLTATTGQKLFILTVAVKNTDTSDNFFNDAYIYSLVDSRGQIYGGHTTELTSAGSKNFSTTLRPGQGIGQPGLHDPLTVAFRIPGNARIVKVMINEGRLGRDEKLFRYFIAGATKDEAGEAGDPKNMVAPLPASARDPADASGATLLDVAKGTMGTYEPSRSFFLRLDNFAYSTDSIYEKNGPPVGKKFAIMTVTAKCPTNENEGIFDVAGGDFPLWAVETTDGDRIKPVGYKKATSDVNADHKFEPGDEYTLRIFFVVDSAAVVKRAVMGAGGGNKWGIDVSAIK